MYKGQLTEAERTHLIEYHKSNIITLEAQINELTVALNNSQSRIKELTNDNLFGEIMIPDYAVNWPVSKKVEYVLSREKHLMTTRQIAEKINEQEGKKISLSAIGDLVSSIGATIKQKVDKKITFGRTLKFGDYYYGLIEWFDADGSVQVQYDAHVLSHLIRNTIMKEELPENGKHWLDRPNKI